MKNLFNFILFFMLCAVLNAQNSPAIKMMQQSRQYIERQEKKGLKLVSFRTDVISSNVEVGKAIILWTDDHCTYHFWAIAENGVGKIQLSVLNRIFEDNTDAELVKTGEGYTVEYQLDRPNEVILVLVKKLSDDNEIGNYAVVVMSKHNMSSEANHDDDGETNHDDHGGITPIDGSSPAQGVVFTQNCNYNFLNNASYKSNLKIKENSDGSRGSTRNVRSKFDFRLDKNKITHKINKVSYVYNIIDQKCDINNPKVLYLTSSDDRGVNFTFRVNIGHREISLQQTGSTEWDIYRITN